MRLSTFYGLRRDQEHQVFYILLFLCLGKTNIASIDSRRYSNFANIPEAARVQAQFLLVKKI
jgi:hypothetical protein